MEICFNDILSAFSFGFDCVEHEVVGVTSNHGKRVAYLCDFLAKQMNMDDKSRVDLAACAILHDCALTEYLYLNKGYRESGVNQDILVRHCILGERNIKNLPFFHDVTGAIYYHHESPDGTGPFHKTTSETPLFAQLIHFSDQLDATCNLSNGSTENYNKVIEFVKKKAGTLFVSEQAALFINTFTLEMLEQISGDNINEAFIKKLPRIKIEANHDILHNIADFIADIIDYKSDFTSRHSLGIAKKVYAMAEYYGYNEKVRDELYFAGTVHDIGKLAINNNILEKPGKLDDAEYTAMKNHAWYTYYILNQMEGMEEITRWASYHHEKLNGKGYPFGKTADQLDEKERLMACIDIYQALTEPRPYKDGFSHEKTMAIMGGMVDRGEIDGNIVHDIDIYFG